MMGKRLKSAIDTALELMVDGIRDANGNVCLPCVACAAYMLGVLSGVPL